MPAIAEMKTASDHPVAVACGEKLRARANHGIPRVASPSAMAPKARTRETTVVRAALSPNAEPMSPHSGTSQAE